MESKLSLIRAGDQNIELNRYKTTATSRGSVPKNPGLVSTARN